MLTWHRFLAVLIKEFVQMRRDRLTFAMMIGVPIMQLVLFGYAINSDPKRLPTAVVSAESSPFARSFVQALENTDYYRVVAQPRTVDEADALVATGQVQFVIHIPEDFSRGIQRGDRPVLLVEADASDPAATGPAVSALTALNLHALDNDLTGSLAAQKAVPAAFEVRVHRRYNPEGITQYNIVPGLMGVVLTMTMIMMTSIAMTRERERGTMENLLATPVSPFEVMLGKIVPYILVGYVQVAVILLAAKFLFQIPMVGSLTLLTGVVVLFIAANLAIGFTFSTIAKSQMQAMQMTMFFFLPSILLSGFMFPFRGMPVWAQWLGEVFPLTHFLRIVRGILLKGSTATDILPSVWPLALILTVVSIAAMRRYNRTLD
ncbi:putative multidrug ABC transporter permease YbhR [Usitatibacter rugosus]|uniref:Putative multidrug ABC transporter permease YbhR n=1 Tax=Usitatibacter rugosus TaxID=2732067 RepID=A0A6M4GNW4_9PROT|nr:ABC transporter permease [Usitatibacter rugosus]QJR09019.1 putative multidrug ABC transporter permease YbhR [Usitatibacter rugosus]